MGGEENVAPLLRRRDARDGRDHAAARGRPRFPTRLGADGSSRHGGAVAGAGSADDAVGGGPALARRRIGYEIFDEPDALGQTQFQQNINRLRALEGELARTIGSLDGISSARVHLVLPERQLFAREAEQPSASIVLQLRRDALTPGQVRAIRNLVAGATPGLTTDRVTIIDETGRLLAAATEGEAGAALRASMRGKCRWKSACGAR